MTHTGSWAWNVSSGELFWSEEQFRIFALDPAGSPPSLAGAFDLVHPDDRAFVRQVLEKVVRDKSEGEWDCRIVTSEGNIRRVHTTAHRVLDDSGNLAEYVGTTMDITDRTLAEEALQQEIQERRRVEEDRRRLLQRLVLAQEEERRRIALEMHDDVGQRLALLQIKLEVLQRKPPADAAQLVAQLVPLTEQVAALTDAVRHLSHDLHSSVLEDLGLEEALRGLIAEFESSCALAIRLSAGRLPRVVPLPVATALYRIAQEALGNAAKHAPGASVNIAVSAMGSKLRLSIGDNGPGFDPQAVRSKGGLGLVSMQERAEMVGGTLAITSVKNRGTRVIATVPWMD
jgi:signal transduction histidine kinase